MILIFSINLMFLSISISKNKIHKFKLLSALKKLDGCQFYFIISKFVYFDHLQIKLKIVKITAILTIKKEKSKKKLKNMLKIL